MKRLPLVFRIFCQLFTRILPDQLMLIVAAFRGAAQQRADRNLSLQPGEGRPEAEVGSEAEREMFVRFAGDVQRGL